MILYVIGLLVTAALFGVVTALIAALLGVLFELARLYLRELTRHG